LNHLIQVLLISTIVLIQVAIIFWNFKSKPTHFHSSIGEWISLIVIASIIIDNLVVIHTNYLELASIAFITGGFIVFNKLMSPSMFIKRIEPIFLLTITLFIHSFLEGFILGNIQSLATSLLFYGSIVVHKSLDSFFISYQFEKYPLHSALKTIILILYVAMTPLGAGFGIELQKLPAHFAHQFAVFNLVSAIFFIYVYLKHDTLKSIQR
jgi:hypothetical protein